jgi:hypothetical protein
MCIQRQNNETHQTLFEKERRREGEMGINRRSGLVQSTLYACMELPQ